MKQKILTLHKLYPHLTKAEIAKKAGCSWAHVYYYLKSSYRDRVLELKRNRRQSKRIQLIQDAGGKCSICGYSKCFRALDFHHLNPKKKELTLGKNMDKSMEVLRKEAKKCILVCSNCHAELHDNQVDIVAS